LTAIERPSGDFDVAKFWNERHGRDGLLTSGGDIGISKAANAAFYYQRLGQLLEIVGSWESAQMPLDILDAGCGKGFFSEKLAECGHRVVGVEPSHNAITATPVDTTVRYVETSIQDFAWPHLFDVVCAIDVLFHIVDAAEWEDTVLALASLVRFEGVLIVTDYETDVRAAPSRYIVHRPLSRYREVLGTVGFASTSVRPYHFRGNRNSFLVFSRCRQ
jgi:2-polyprenyl-3-methyl-5-hydroxy-6-metoxy-1,4-benzoquinol methylase